MALWLPGATLVPLRMHQEHLALLDTPDDWPGFDQAMAGLSPEERRATIHGLATFVENLGAAETAAAREVEASKGSAA